ncbi:unnamed protein product [Clavelina lepadiformis]|uniref:glutaminase n=1 Tax=Clavelina lepadiformis TaxID=159417 RepID=A0ABP0FGB5_CLALP
MNRIGSLFLFKPSKLLKRCSFARNNTSAFSTHQENEKEAGTLIFRILANGDSTVTVKKIQDGIKNSGILWKDPRLVNFRDRITTLLNKNEKEYDATDINLNDFLHILDDDDNKTLELMCKVFSKSCAIPNFQNFIKVIEKLYLKAANNMDGKVADYIPQLAKADPNLWGVSVCTIDGQRYSFGDTDQPFCLQSCVKPIAYAVAVSDYHASTIHQYMGEEPSGLYFNALHLNTEDKPHNPLINAGSIVICSLIKPELPLADRFHYVLDNITELCGREQVGFDNTVFLSEKETSYRNFAIAYYLMEKDCFPPNTQLEPTLDFYLQLCAITATCESASVAAATFANGGVSPLFEHQKRLLGPVAVRNTLSLMHSCGMYDYSGKFAFHVGLPAKSGVAGGLFVVVPNVMGIMCRSPLLDEKGNSVRGIQFCEELVKHFNFHIYDDLHHSIKKSNPRNLQRELTDLELSLRKVGRRLFNYASDEDDLD